MTGRYILETVRVFAYSDNGRARFSVLGLEEASNREGATWRSGKDREELACTDSVEELAEERVQQEVILGVASFGVVIYEYSFVP